MCHEFLREPVLTPGKYVAWQFWLAVLVLLAKKSFKLIRPDRPHADKGTDHHTGLYLPLALCSLTATLPSQKLVIKILDFKERKAGTQLMVRLKLFLFLNLNLKLKQQFLSMYETAKQAYFAVWTIWTLNSQRVEKVKLPLFSSCFYDHSDDDQCTSRARFR